MKRERKRENEWNDILGGRMRFIHETLQSLVTVVHDRDLAIEDLGGNGVKLSDLFGSVTSVSLRSGSYLDSVGLPS